MLRKTLVAVCSALFLAVPGATGAALAGPPPSPHSQLRTASEDASSSRHVSFHEWSRTAAFAHGTRHGVRFSHDALSIKRPVGTRTYTDPFGDGGPSRYDYATWTSPMVRPGFDLNELIASWNATTPGGTWLQVEMRGRADTGAMSKWYVMGRWDEDDPAAGGAIHRTSVPQQGDDLGYVAVDTFVASGDHTLSRYQLRVSLYRPHGTHETPRVRLVGAMASHLDVPDHVPASPLGGAEGITLDVPTYSQEIHNGEYPQWDGGGEAWCSPTSTSMVLAYWRSGPEPDDYAWVDPAYQDPWVDHAARNTYDYSYDGAGNWPFNAAYAGRFGLEGFVTRLRSLTEAEQFIKQGIPLVVSVSWDDGELDGAGYSTGGHLMVIVGFTKDGDVVVNDPASHLIPSDDQVRTVYDREQFENTWIPHSGGVAYVIHPRDVPLPEAPAEANW